MFARDVSCATRAVYASCAHGSLSERCLWSVSLVSEEYTIILDSYSTGTDVGTIISATGMPWARSNTRIVKIVEKGFTYVWTLPRGVTQA